MDRSRPLTMATVQCVLRARTASRISSDSKACVWSSTMGVSVPS